MRNMNLIGQATGIVWFRAENYDQLAAMFEDGITAGVSYDDWLYAAETRRQALEGAGARVMRVVIDPEEFPRWCKTAGKKLDAEGRKAYTAYIASKLLISAAVPFAWH